MAPPLAVPILLVYFVIRALTRRRARYRIFDFGLGPFELTLRLFTISAGTSLLMLEHPVLAAVVLLIGLPPYSVPAWLARLGAFRLAAVTAFALHPLMWRRRSRELGLFCLALGCINHPHGFWVGYVRRRVARLPPDCFGGGVAASALIALEPGDEETARALFTAVVFMPSELAPRWLRAFAKDFLLADAAARENWQEVLHYSCSKPITLNSFVFRWGALERLAALGQASPRARYKTLAYLAASLSPHRKPALRFLRWCAHTEASVPAPSTETAPSLVSLLHVMIQPAGSLLPEVLDAAARNATLMIHSADFTEAVSQRLEQLGRTGRFESVVAQLSDEVRGQLLTHYAASFRLATPSSGLGMDLLGESHARAMDSLEQLVQALCTREDPVRRLNGIPAWTVWGKITALAEQRVAINPECRSDLVLTLGYDLTNTAVDLQDAEDEQVLGHQIFAFLHRYYEHCEDQELKQLIANNYEASAL